MYMLNLLERYENFVEEGLTGLNAHRILEVMKCECGKIFRISFPDAFFVLKSGLLRGKYSW